MLQFDPKDYRNFVYGVVPLSFLKKKKSHPFVLWGESLILFWNKGDVRCFKNHCRHYGLPLDMGRLKDEEIECGFHGWRYQLSSGELLLAPLAKKQPKCSLRQYKAFIKGGIVFVYAGEPDFFEKATHSIFENVLERPASAWTVYETSFYWSMNSSMDFPHHTFHSFFYQLYGVYRTFLNKGNPLKKTYTPVMLEEAESFFKFKISESDVEIEVRPFCTEYNDIQAGNRWQMFIMPIDEKSCQYLINIESKATNFLFRWATYFMFYTFIKYLAMPEDQKWLKNSNNDSEQKEHVLCDHDFGIKNYIRKFYIKPKNIMD
jgi:phenylpropionate dioxygenase-like ring-hydroxylating dioxygenase large terminal subunit